MTNALLLAAVIGLLPTQELANTRRLIHREDASGGKEFSRAVFAEGGASLRLSFRSVGGDSRYVP